jgi:hypothetical protein
VQRGQRAAKAKPKSSGRKGWTWGLPGGRTAPVNVGSLRMTRRAMRITKAGKDSITLAGRDYVASVQIATGDAIGDVKFVTSIHPDMLATSTRLSIIAQAYERFLFHPANGRAGCTFHLQSSSATSVSGAIAVCIDLDPGDNILPLTGNGANGKVFAVAHNGHISKCWENTSIALPATHQQKDYWVDDGSSDARLTQQGRMYVIVAEVPNATMYFDLWMDYEVTLRVAQLDLAATTTSAFATLVNSSTVQTAANPIWLNSSSVVPVGTSYLPAGVGIGATAGSNYIYFRPGFSSPVNFLLYGNFICTAFTGFTLAGTGCTIVDNHSTAAATCTAAASGTYVTTNPTTGTSAYTNAVWWDGLKWNFEANPAATNYQWQIAITATTLTACTALTFHLIPVALSNSSFSLQRRQQRSQGAHLGGCCDHKAVATAEAAIRRTTLSVTQQVPEESTGLSLDYDLLPPPGWRQLRPERKTESKSLK